MTTAATPWDPERHARRLAPAGALLAGGGGCVGGVPGLLLALAGAALLLASCYSARDGLLLLGPLTRAELTRAARLRRPWLWRALYALAAGGVLLGSVNSKAPGLLDWSPAWYSPGTIAAINYQVTGWFALLLSVYAVFLTVQLTPSIVAEEREAKRWDLLLTTDLRPREILLGKATARLLMVGEPVLAVLPVLAIMPLLGGVSPAAVALFGVALLAVVASTAAVGVFHSAFSETSKDAQSRTVGLLGAYYLVSGGLVAAAVIPQFGGFPRFQGVPSPVVVEDLAEWAAVGNPVVLLYPALRSGTGHSEVLAEGLPRFLAFHAGVVLLYGLTACRALRFAVPWRKQPRGRAWRVRRAERDAGPTPDRPVYAAVATARPPIGDEPLTWWTRYGHLCGRMAADLARPRRFFGWVFAWSLVLLAAAYPLDYLWPWGRGVWLGALRMIVPVAVWCATTPLFLRPLFHAAGSIAGERQADTLLGLLLMPYSSREIVVQKWRGSVLESRNVYYFLLTFGLAATLTGFLHPLSLPALAVVVWPGTALAAAVGVYFSATATTAARAKRWTALAVFGGGYLGLIAGGSVVQWLSSKRFVTDAAGKFADGQAALLAVPCPPATTFFPAMLSTFTMEKVRLTTFDYVSGVVCVLAGCVVQSLAAYAVLGAAARRFDRGRGA